MPKKSGCNTRQAGAPDRKVILDLNHLDNAKEDLLNRCKNKKEPKLYLHILNDMRNELVDMTDMVVSILVFVSIIQAETPLSPGCTQMSPQVGTQLTPQWTQWSTGWTPLSPPYITIKSRSLI